MPLQLPKEESTLENSKIMILTEGALARRQRNGVRWRVGKGHFSWLGRLKLLAKAPSSMPTDRSTSVSGRMAYLMAVAPASTPTEVCILDSRKRRKNTARATKGGQMETSTMESGKMVHSMVTAHTQESQGWKRVRWRICGWQEACTSENFKMA